MKKDRIFVMLVVFLFFGLSEPEARSLPVTLTELANYSDLIVIGRVYTSNDHNKTNTRNININSVVVGSSEIGQIESLRLSAPPSDRVEESKPALGQRYVFFLTECHGQYRIVFGYAGRVAVNINEVVATADIIGQPKKQPLKEFIRKIKSVEKLPTLRAVPREWICRT